MNQKQVIIRVAEALEDAENAKEELVALGTVAAGVICQTSPEGRQRLVDVFCRTLRETVKIDMN